MGNYSWLVVAMNGASSCVIDWDACRFSATPGEGYHITMLSKGDDRPLTIEALGKALHDHKLFGYLDDGYIEAFHELCRHCRMTDGSHAFPRLYFEEEGWQRLHYLEFRPGTDVVMWGYYSFDDDDVSEGEDVTPEQHQRALERLVEAPEGWVVRRLMPMGADADRRRGSALPVLMTLFGIRPEDPDALKKAASVFDVKAASTATAESLFDSH